MRIAAFVFAALSALISVADDTPRFAAAKPVWPKGMALERNLFVGFNTCFDAKEGERPLLRITGASDYRIWLNGEHVGWGPARAAKGYFRVDEIPLQVKAGQKNILAVEVAGYNVNSFCTMCQPSFLQAEVVLGDKVLAATGVNGGFSARILPAKSSWISAPARAVLRTCACAGAQPMYTRSTWDTGSWTGNCGMIPA